MIMLVAARVMSLAAMAALTVVIFTEKLWHYGRPFARPSGWPWWRPASWPCGSRGCYLACTPRQCQ
jgi:predicted metal-binding membrane protein